MERLLVREVVVADGSTGSANRLKWQPLPFLSHRICAIWPRDLTARPGRVTITVRRHSFGTVLLESLPLVFRVLSSSDSLVSGDF